MDPEAPLMAGKSVSLLLLGVEKMLRDRGLKYELSYKGNRVLMRDPVTGRTRDILAPTQWEEYEPFCQRIVSEAQEMSLIET